MGMMKNSSDGHTKACIAIIAVVAFFFRKWGDFKRFTVWTFRIVTPSDIFKVGNAIIIGGTSVIDSNDIHANISKLSTDFADIKAWF